MKLFHGSTVIVPEPQVDYSQKDGDFGRGFYTTENQEQAEQWALSKMSRSKAQTSAIVSIYNFEFPKGARVKRFDKPDQEWLDFIIKGRRGHQFNEYDIIIGPLAGDSINKTIALYENGTITTEIALMLLGEKMENKSQTTFIRQEMCDKLEFSGSYEYARKTREGGTIAKNERRI